MPQLRWRSRLCASFGTGVSQVHMCPQRQLPVQSLCDLLTVRPVSVRPISANLIFQSSAVETRAALTQTPAAFRVLHGISSSGGAGGAGSSAQQPAGGTLDPCTRHFCWQTLDPHAPDTAGKLVTRSCRCKCRRASGSGSGSGDSAARNRRSGTQVRRIAFLAFLLL